MEGLQARMSWFMSHKWSLISLALSVGVYTSAWLMVDHVYNHGAWDRHSTLGYRLASLQGGVGLLSVLIAVLAIWREPRPRLAFIALRDLGCSFGRGLDFQR
jgi:hypothetical protein